jgi:hypothetical protein
MHARYRKKKLCQTLILGQKQVVTNARSATSLTAKTRASPWPSEKRQTTHELRDQDATLSKNSTTQKARHMHATLYRAPVDNPPASWRLNKIAPHNVRQLE